MTESRTCQNCHETFPIAPEDLAFYEKIQVPAPMFCPPCRYQRRLANRNEWNMYQRKCSLCGKDMISIYSPTYAGPVYCQPCWWSDSWDPMTYGREYDFSRPFFEQFKEFRMLVPRPALTNLDSVNSEYSNQSEGNKNCYMVVATGMSEQCLYGNWYQQCRDSVDCYNMEKCEMMYESLNCANCFRSAYVEDCYDCHSCSFSKDLRGCESCFGCYGLRNKKYCFLNEQLTKEAYEAKVHGFVWNRANISRMRADMKRLELGLPHKFYHGRNTTDSAGDYLEDTNDTLDAFNCRHNEHLRHCQDAWDAKQCYDLTETLTEEFDYELEGCAYTARCKFLCRSQHLFDCNYCEICYHSNDLFGCMALRKKKYCILNRQYTKEDYDRLLAKIVAHMKTTGEWGEFFPASISPFAYNETVAQDYFPLTKGEVLARGWRWYDRDPREYQTNMAAAALPETISEVSDEILSKMIRCENQESDELKKKYLNCTTAYRIIKQELEFYRKMGLSLPRKCFPCRRQDRLGLRNPRKLWPRQCMCDKTGHASHQGRCPTTFQTSYAPDRPEIVYCEACYQNEIS